jgi:hypothetical protein
MGGLPDGLYFLTKNAKLGIFLKAWYGIIWGISWPFGILIEIFGIFYGHLVFLLSFWCTFSHFVCCTKKNLAPLGGSYFVWGPPGGGKHMSFIIFKHTCTNFAYLTHKHQSVA